MANNDIGGVWRTVSGRRIFIKEGQDLTSAMKESGKFKYKNSDIKKSNLDIKAEKIVTKMSSNDIDPKKEYDEWQQRIKEQEKNEYELYKRAIENPDSIDPMTENSTDWEALDKKYSGKYNNEKQYNEYVKNTLNNDDYLRENRPNEYFQKMLREKDSELREETLKNLDVNAKEAVKQGIDKNEFAQKNAERGINTTKSDEAYNKAQEKSLNSLRRKDEKILKQEYQQYLKEHPNSKLTFEDFKK